MSCLSEQTRIHRAERKLARMIEKSSFHYLINCDGCYCLREGKNPEDKHYALRHNHGGISLTLYEDSTYWFRRFIRGDQEVSCGYWEQTNNKVTLISNRKVYYELVKREDNDNHKINYGYRNFKAIYHQHHNRICQDSIDYTYRDERIEEDSLLEVFDFYGENTLSFAENDTIYAISEGIVGLDLEKGDDSKLITMKHISTHSFHQPCKQSFLKWGDFVKKGQPIGIREGDTLKTWMAEYPF